MFLMLMISLNGCLQMAPNGDDEGKIDDENKERGYIIFFNFELILANHNPHI